MSCDPLRLRMQTGCLRPQPNSLIAISSRVAYCTRPDGLPRTRNTSPLLGKEQAMRSWSLSLVLILSLATLPEANGQKQPLAQPAPLPAAREAERLEPRVFRL